MITNTVAKGSFFLLFFVSQLSRQNPQNKTVSQHCIAHPDDYPFFIFLVVSFFSSTCPLLVYLSSPRLPVPSVLYFRAAAKFCWKQARGSACADWKAGAAV